jgi:hypothetical protein
MRAIFPGDAPYYEAVNNLIKVLHRVTFFAEVPFKQPKVPFKQPEVPFKQPRWHEAAWTPT